MSENFHLAGRDFCTSNLYPFCKGRFMLFVRKSNFLKNIYFSILIFVVYSQWNGLYLYNKIANCLFKVYICNLYASTVFLVRACRKINYYVLQIQQNYLLEFPSLCTSISGKSRRWIGEGVGTRQGREDTKGKPLPQYETACSRPVGRFPGTPSMALAG